MRNLFGAPRRVGGLAFAGGIRYARHPAVADAWAATLAGTSVTDEWAPINPESREAWSSPHRRARAPRYEARLSATDTVGSHGPHRGPDQLRTTPRTIVHLGIAVIVLSTTLDSVRGAVAAA